MYEFHIEGYPGCLDLLDTIIDVAEKRSHNPVEYDVLQFCDDMKYVKELCIYGDEIVISSNAVEGYTVASGEYFILKDMDGVLGVQIEIPRSFVDCLDEIICNL